MNGKRMQFMQGVYRFKPDGAGFEFLTGLDEQHVGPRLLGDLRCLRLDGEQRAELLPGDSESLLRGRPRAQLRRARVERPGLSGRGPVLCRALHHAVHPAGRRARRLHVGGRPPPVYGALVPEAVLESHRVHHRADGAHRRPGRHGAAGRGIRDARRLEPDGRRRGMGGARARAGRTGRRGVGGRLVQLHLAAQPDADRLQQRPGERLRDVDARSVSAAASTASIYKDARPADRMSLIDERSGGAACARSPRTTCSGGCTRSACWSSAARRTSCRS